MEGVGVLVQDGPEEAFAGVRQPGLFRTGELG